MPAPPLSPSDEADIINLHLAMNLALEPLLKMYPNRRSIVFLAALSQTFAALAIFQKDKSTDFTLYKENLLHLLDSSLDLVAERINALGDN